MKFIKIWLDNGDEEEITKDEVMDWFAETYKDAKIAYAGLVASSDGFRMRLNSAADVKLGI